MKVNNLVEFIKQRGFDDPYSWARALYKYIDCGPWVSFIFDNADIYYKDIDPSKNLTGCKGIKIGSIVEGSDVEIGPEVFMFPFDTNDLDDTIENINNEATFYWKRDNSRYFTLINTQTNKIAAYITETWGEYSWDDFEVIKQGTRKRVHIEIENWDDFEEKYKTWIGYKLVEDETPDIIF